MTLHLTSIDPVHLSIGSVLCPLSNPVPLATTFTARVIVFDIQVPITSGTSVHHFPPVVYLKLTKGLGGDFSPLEGCSCHSETYIDD